MFKPPGNKVRANLTTVHAPTADKHAVPAIIRGYTVLNWASVSILYFCDIDRIVYCFCNVCRRFIISRHRGIIFAAPAHKTNTYY